MPLEVMARMPIIASNVSAIPEIALHRETGVPRAAARPRRADAGAQRAHCGLGVAAAYGLGRGRIGWIRPSAWNA